MRYRIIDLFVSQVHEVLLGTLELQVLLATWVLLVALVSEEKMAFQVHLGQLEFQDLVKDDKVHQDPEDTLDFTATGVNKVRQVSSYCEINIQYLFAHLDILSNGNL